jgi:hypothetical protein
MKQLIVLLLSIICFSCVNEKKINPVLLVDVSKDIVFPKHYIVAKTQAPITIDGNANEPIWDSALYTDNFIDIEGIKTPKYDTKVKMLWDDNYLYVYSELKEPHIWGDIKQRDAIIYYNNDFEIFIDPSGNGTGYGEIEINALNTVWDLYLDKPYRIGGNANFDWNLNQLKTNVKIQGTLNNPKDIDSLWSVEMAIPLKPFIRLKNNPKNLPKEGEQWRLNFSRVQWDHDITNGNYSRKKKDNKYLREYNWVWSNQKVINMHEPEKWGYLQFTEASSSKEIAFIEDPDLNIKQTLFALFRKTRYGDLKYLLEHNYGFKQELDIIYSKGKRIPAIFYKTNIGFEYKIETTNKTYIINNEGALKHYE